MCSAPRDRRDARLRFDVRHRAPHRLEDGAARRAVDDRENRRARPADRASERAGRERRLFHFRKARDHRGAPRLGIAIVELTPPALKETVDDVKLTQDQTLEAVYGLVRSINAQARRITESVFG